MAFRQFQVISRNAIMQWEFSWRASVVAYYSLLIRWSIFFSKIQCNAFLMWSIFSPWTPHSSPMRVRYECILWVHSLNYFLPKPVQCCIWYHCIWLSFNSLGPNDAIWQQGSRSTLVQVMACCLTAPSHYLNQCWLIISGVHWDSPEGNFTKDTSAISQ